MSERRLGASEIASEIRRQIVDGSVAAHDRLPPERALAEHYGVARGTIREAMGRLAQEGLVDVRRGSGNYVREQANEPVGAVIRRARPLELVDARFALEPHICRLAVLHARADDLAGAERLLLEMEASVDDPATFADADTRLHTLLAEATGNNLLIWIIGQINVVRSQEQWSRMRNVTLDADTIRLYNRQHREIVDAIGRHDAEGAANSMKEHLQSARLSLMRAASA